ncbi:MAG TPA: glycoside hydrolase [Pedobacter sp.]|nr:glycoside hydrolase [Pedobacter sp.]
MKQIVTYTFNLFCISMCSAVTLFGAPLQDTVVTVKIDFNKKAQTIDNFGSSGCWFSEGIGKDWPSEKREKIAELLFSKAVDSKGQPQGIGLSAWRFNIGAGTTEQGDSSGIRDFRKRSDSFLSPDGTYNWNKQSGYRFFLQKAKDYGVENLIAFSNSPPVQFTKNGLGYKTEKDFVSNLREDAYQHYAKFLSAVVKHFDAQKLHFNYISPVNEPQWDWSRKYKEADQEGSPWTNEEIYKIVKALNKELEFDQLSTQISVSEAGALYYLYAGSGGASRQIQNFFDPKSKLYMGNFSRVPKIIAGHSYFTESDDSVLVETRKQLAGAAKAFGVNYWQSEYSMLANGFREGKKGRRTDMDCALFLSKVIHADLTVGNATAWQFWNAYEPGPANFDTRYYLIALKPDPDFKNGEFSATKNLWALGHYSRFVRPGMTRLEHTSLDRNGLNLEQSELMLSAYVDQKNNLVIVGTNYGATALRIRLDLKNNRKKYKSATRYLTTDVKDMDMKPEHIRGYNDLITLPARSISTIVLN